MSCRDVLPVQEWYTAAELAGLEGLPESVSGVIRRAKSENWPAKKRQGRGGGKEYAFASLPQITQDAILSQALTTAGTGNDVLEEAEPVAKAALPRYEELNEDQLAVMAARVAFVREIERLQQVTTQKKAIQTLVDAARDGDLTPYLAERVERANDRKTATRTLRNGP